MPAYRLYLYSVGVQIWCAPTVDDREMWRTSMRHIAYEGRCFVLSACQYTTRADNDDPDEIMIGGGSMIVSPFGEILAGPLTDGPGLLVADLDMGEIAKGKFDLDVAGHYSRPDIFTLEVNTRPQHPVRTR